MTHTDVSQKKRFYINCLIVLFTIIGCILRFTAIDSETNSAAGLSCLKYFTVDSNILAGIAALVFAVRFAGNSVKRSTEIAAICLISFLIGLLIRFLNKRFRRKYKKESAQ